ncbi:MAG TPA: BlaI/MecI/CopY family transcriptional regulator [Tepidisphaeraceae bacterium]|nr:BlaI/MecI/CopY family transcriptional regulator [Tepidisphaeraceae bacterium]
MASHLNPTAAELAILRALWTLKTGTVRQVHEALTAAGSDVGYTTILKLLQIMTEKGLVVRDDSRRTHVYQAAFAQEQTQRRLVADLLKKAFDNSAQKLVMQALSAKKASKAELREIRKLIDQMEKEAP